MKRVKVYFSLCLALLLVAGITLFMASCKDAFNNNVDCENYNYSDCETTEPFEANFHIKLTINGENPAVPIAIYKGKLEDGMVFLLDTVTETTYDTLLPVDQYYTVAAKYTSGSNTFTAVDGDKISKKHTQTCDSVCWSVQTGTANVRLK